MNFNPTRRFGVEFELYYDREAISEVFQRRRFPFYNHFTDQRGGNRESSRRADRRWSIKSDGSLNSGGIEITTPALRGTLGLSLIEQFMQYMRNVKARVDSACGLHVHHEATDLSPLNLINVFALYQNLFDEIKAYFHLDRLDRTCCNMNNENVIRAWERSPEDILMKLAEGGHYKAVNFSSVGIHGTIEFRHLEGTLDSEILIPWIIFTQQLLETAKGLPEKLALKKMPLIPSIKNILGIKKPEQGIVKDATLSFLKRCRENKRFNDLRFRVSPAIVVLPFRVETAVRPYWEITEISSGTTATPL